MEREGQTDKGRKRRKGKEMSGDYISEAVHSPSADCPVIHKLAYSLIHAIHACAKTHTEAIDLATKGKR